MRYRLPIAFVLATFVALFAFPSFAQQTGLPGNASTLREAHKDWRVVCISPEGKVRCTLSQTQVRGESRQRVLSIELTSTDGGNVVNGALVLPFGLNLASGVTFQLDKGQVGEIQSFRTCLPVGCIVDITWDISTINSLRKGNQLNIIATADGGQGLIFSISLGGFSSALDRAVELLQ